MVRLSCETQHMNQPPVGKKWWVWFFIMCSVDRHVQISEV